MMDSSHETALLQTLFDHHIPSAIRAIKTDTANDLGVLHLGERAIDDFWGKHQKDLIRHTTVSLQFFRKDAERDIAQADLNQLFQDLLSAELELRLEPEMTARQKSQLGDLFSALGKRFSTITLYEHSKYCMAHAAHLFGSLRQHSREDECWYLEAKANFLAARGWSHLRQWPLFAFGGFGYRPYRLLYFSLLTVFLFAGIYYALLPTSTLVDAVLFSATNYLTLLGYGDMASLRTLDKVVIVTQGFVSLVLNSTLFALLVRRWFRV